MNSFTTLSGAQFDGSVMYKIDLWPGGIKLSGKETSMAGWCDNGSPLGGRSGDLRLFCQVNWGLGNCGTATFTLEGIYKVIE